ncbi:hypothetical protein CGRA01v4_02918 [Colletotrichum graminicola]|nr:hypothetical protein CGRA01v4_02918 [Colletotrichum graminicola]
MIPSHFLLRTVTGRHRAYRKPKKKKKERKKTRNSATRPSTKQKPPCHTTYVCEARKRGASARAVGLFIGISPNLLTACVRDVVAARGVSPLPFSGGAVSGQKSDAEID